MPVHTISFERDAKDMVINYKNEHRETLADVFCEVYYDDPYYYDWLKKNDVLRYFSDMEKHPNFCGFTFVEENKIIGGCLGIINDYFKIRKYRISEMFITPKLQMQGLGRAYLKDIEGKMKEKHMDIVELQTQNNLSVYKFYKKLGYIGSEHMTYMIKSIKKE